MRVHGDRVPALRYYGLFLLFADDQGCATANDNDCSNDADDQACVVRLLFGSAGLSGLGALRLGVVRL